MPPRPTARPEPPPSLGEFEQLLLLAVLQCGDEAYTVPVRTVLEDKAGRHISRGAVHTTLERLEGKAETDFATARRLFTLICVLHIKG